MYLYSQNQTLYVEVGCVVRQKGWKSLVHAQSNHADIREQGN